MHSLQVTPKKTNCVIFILFFFGFSHLSIAQSIIAGGQTEMLRIQNSSVESEGDQSGITEQKPVSSSWSVGIYGEKLFKKVYLRGALNFLQINVDDQFTSTYADSLTRENHYSYRLSGAKLTLEFGEAIHLNERFQFRYGGLAGWRQYFPYSIYRTQQEMESGQLQAQSVTEITTSGQSMFSLAAVFRFQVNFAKRLQAGVGIQYGFTIGQDNGTIQYHETVTDDQGTILNETFKTDQKNNFTFSLDNAFLPSLTLGYRFGKTSANVSR